MGKPLLWALTAALVTGAFASPADARRKRPKKGSVALFPVTGDNEAIVTEVNRILEAAMREAGISLIAGPTLKRRLKAAPAQAVDRCLGNPACIGKLSKRARTELAAVGVSSHADIGVKIAFQLITSKGRVEREATIEIAAPETTRAALESSFETLFLAPPPATLTGETDDALAAMGDLDLMPLEPVEEIPADEPGELNDPLADVALTTLPQLEDPLEDDPDIEPAPDPTPVQPIIAAVDPEVAVNVEPVEPSEPSQWLFYTSIAMISGGALVAGGGGFFGVRSMLTVNDANDDKSIDQIRADEMQREADDHAYRANLLYIIGGALAVTGGVMLAIDMMLTDDIEPSVRLSADGAAAGVLIRF